MLHFIFVSLNLDKISTIITAWEVSKYGVISGPYFPVFGINIGKHGPEVTPYLVTFHAVYKFVVERCCSSMSFLFLSDFLGFTIGIHNKPCLKPTLFLFGRNLF